VSTRGTAYRSDPAGGEERPGLARRPALLTVLVVAVLLAVLAVLLVPWSWIPGGHLVPRSAASLFTPEQLDRAERYSWLRRGLGWASYATSLALLVVLGLTRRGSRMLRRLPGPWWVAVPLGALVALLLERAVTLPFAIGAHRTDQVFGISRQAWSGWSLDVVKGLAVSWVATSLALLVLVACSRRSPRWWFAWAGAAALALSLAGSFLYPVLVEPLFNRFAPMPSGPFKASILRLADREGVQVEDVLVADASRRTTTLNAYVSGFGGTRRVVVYDNLLEELTPAQARVVIAHELAHAKNRDVVTGTALAGVGAVAGVALLALLLDSSRLRRHTGTSGPADPSAVFTVLALVAVGGFVVSPVQNTVSRAFEARADRVSLQATGADATFVAMQRQLALTSLADPTPPWLSQLWFGSHPTVLQRAGLPESMRTAHR
jgi:STE24 endopeptidase